MAVLGASHSGSAVGRSGRLVQELEGSSVVRDGQVARVLTVPGLSPDAASEMGFSERVRRAELADPLVVERGRDVLVEQLGAQLGPTAYSELGVDGLDVVFDGVAGDPQCPGDLLVGGAP